MNDIAEKEKNVVIVYMEQTPNPLSLKFVSNQLLLPEGSVEFNDKASAFYCPLAYQLFDFTGVKSVFITSNFVTVTKSADLDWFEIQNILREFIRGFLLSGDPVFTKNPFEEKSNSDSYQNGSLKLDLEKKEKISNNLKPQTSNLKPQTELENQIIQLLDEYVKPAVEQDGGAIDFKSFEDGVVTVVLKGSCSGCPSSTLTLKSGIERLLKQMMPEVTEVVAE